MQSTLREGAGRGMARDFADGRRPFTGPRVVRNDGAAQRVTQSGPDAAFSGTMIVKIFVKRRGHPVFDGRLYPVSRKPGARPLAKTGSSASPLPRVMGQLRSPGPGAHTGERPFSVSRPFPMLPVWVPLLLPIRMPLPRNGRISVGERQQR